MAPIRLSLLLLGATLAAGDASAEGRSMDVELVRPTFSQDAIPGMDHPAIEPGVTVLGAMGQYTRAPLLLYVQGEEEGAVVADRTTLQLGLSQGLTQRFSTRLVIPVVMQWGSEVPGLSADGLMVGDPSVGARFRLTERLSMSADAYLPFGATEAWVGEGAARGSLRLTGATGGDHVEVLADLGIMAREPKDTHYQLALGAEALAGLGLRYHPWPGRVALHAAVLGRASVSRQAGGAGNRVGELLLGSRWRGADGILWDVGVGKGLTPGYGTSSLRALVGVTTLLERRAVEFRPPPQEVVVQARVVEAPPREDIPVVPWEPDQLARLQEAEIEIRDPIQFQYDTDIILSESLPTLGAVAEIMQENNHITSIVVEGHASAEGEHGYNYLLSIRRAAAVQRALVEAGVNVGRLSCRGMGEVEPVVEGEDEESLAANRRVMFLIEEQGGGDDALEDEGPSPLPWAPPPPADPPEEQP